MFINDLLISTRSNSPSAVELFKAERFMHILMSLCVPRMFYQTFQSPIQKSFQKPFVRYFIFLVSFNLVGCAPLTLGP